MTDFYQALFGRPAPWVRPRGEDRRPARDANVVSPAGPPTGATMGAMVGGRIEAEQSRSRTVTFNPMRADAPELPDDAFEQGRAMTRFQRSNGDDIRRIGQQMRFRPVLPDFEDEETGSAFPFAPATSRAPPTARAARAVGVPREFLDALIVQESGGDAHAKASTSSATGHAQFIDSTWRRMMRQYGPRYGFNADDIGEDDLLDLRRDPQWAAIMAAEYARENATALQTSLGREPRQHEVYLAHFLGAGDAVDLIRAAERDRRREGGRASTAASIVSPASAAANRNVFYANGRARTAGEVVDLQGRKFSRDAFTIRDYGF